MEIEQIGWVILVASACLLGASLITMLVVSNLSLRQIRRQYRNEIRRAYGLDIDPSEPDPHERGTP